MIDLYFSGNGAGKWEKEAGRRSACHSGASDAHREGEAKGKEETREESKTGTNEDSGQR